MQLTPEQRHDLVTEIGALMTLYVHNGDINVFCTWKPMVEDIADAAINAILSLPSPPCAEVVTGTLSDAPSHNTVIVPKTPEPERIESMCLRYDHGFHIPALGQNASTTKWE